MKFSSLATIAAFGRSHIRRPAQSYCSKQRGNAHGDGSAGHFVTSPWEGLRWEAGPRAESLAESELVDGIEKFLASLTHGGSQ